MPGQRREFTTNPLGGALRCGGWCELCGWRRLSQGSSAFKSRSSSRREAPPPPLPETELGTYSTYSDNVKDADDPHRVDSNPIVDHAAGSEGDLDDVDIAPGGGDEY